MGLTTAACKCQSHTRQLQALAQHEHAGPCKTRCRDQRIFQRNAAWPLCAGSSSVSNVASCPDTPVTYPPGSVSSYSVVDTKLGNALGLDTNTPAQQAGTGAAAGGGTAANTPLAVNGLMNGGNNAGTNNGLGNGQGNSGAGNGNRNGNSNAGSANGNGNGIGNVGNGNGVNNGNGNTNQG